MTTFKAPAGGLVSKVNGQFYEGGEFMPDHGRACGRAKSVKAVAKLDEIRVLVGRVGWTLTETDAGYSAKRPTGGGHSAPGTIAGLSGLLRAIKDELSRAKTTRYGPW